MTFQPSALNSARTRLSLFLFRAIFSLQNSTLLFGSR